MIRTFYEDVIPKIKKSVDVQSLMDSTGFWQLVQEMRKQRKEEWMTDMVPIQVEYDLLLAGADGFASWY